jgi:hypothetical protein
MNFALRLFTVVGFALAVAPVSGALIYRDALPSDGAGNGNTTINGAIPVLGTNYQGGSGATSGALQTDHLWYYRTPTSTTNNGTPPNNGSFWETDGSSAANSETAPPLITTITVPAPGTYNLYAMFITSGQNYGDIMVGVNNSDPSTHKYFNYQNMIGGAPFDTPGVSTLTTATATEFDNANSSPNPVQTRWAGGSFTMYLAELGQFNLASTTVDFYITGPNVASPSTLVTQRTVYEGVAYELVPEPSGLILAAFGVTSAVVAIGRRRSARKSS